MKKVIHPLTLLLTMVTSHSLQEATACAPQALPSALLRKGRMGLGIAGEYTHIATNLAINYSPFGSNFQSTQSQIGKHFQVAPSLEIGTILSKDYYLGALISWRPLGATPQSRAPIKGLSHFFHQSKINYYSDILIKGGYKTNSCMLVYGLVGPSIAKWEHTTDQFSSQLKTDTFKIKRTSIGLGVGFGFECLLKEKYTLSVDYTHHFHKAASKKKHMSFMDNIGGPILRSGDVYKNVKPKYATIAIRVTRYIDW